jgi:glucose dehydrogenase
MARIFISFAPVVLVSLLLPVGTSAQGTPARDWLTWGYDQERTGWNKGETTLSEENVGRLELRWSAQLSTPPKDVVLSTLTAPLVVERVNTSQGRKNLMFLVGSDDTVFALDTDTGKPLWQKTFPNNLTPRQAATWLCSNTQNATPVIDKQKSIIYLNTSDGKTARPKLERW